MVALGVIGLVSVGVVVSAGAFWLSFLWHRTHSLLPVEDGRVALINHHCGLWLEQPRAPRGRVGVRRRPYPFARFAAYSDLLVFRCEQIRICLRFSDVTELTPMSRPPFRRGLRIGHQREDLAQIVVWSRHWSTLQGIVEQRGNRCQEAAPVS